MEDEKKDEKEFCFVIMPFGGWRDNYYQDIYQPAIIKAGLLPKRADDLYRPSNIVKEIWELTKNAKLLLADLTGKNPNVMYELGLAHAIRKPAVLVTENIDDIPFDLRGLRVLDYDKDNPRWAEILQSNITQSLVEVLNNPIASVPVPFMDVFEGDKTNMSEFQNMLWEHELEFQNMNSGEVWVEDRKREELFYLILESARIAAKDGISLEDTIRRFLFDKPFGTDIAFRMAKSGITMGDIGSIIRHAYE